MEEDEEEYDEAIEDVVRQAAHATLSLLSRLLVLSLVVLLLFEWFTRCFLLIS